MEKCESKASIDLKIEGKQNIETEDGKLHCLIDLFWEKIQSKRTVTLVYFFLLAASTQSPGYVKKYCKAKSHEMLYAAGGVTANVSILILYTFVGFFFSFGFDLVHVSCDRGRKRMKFFDTFHTDAIIKIYAMYWQNWMRYYQEFQHHWSSMRIDVLYCHDDFVLTKCGEWMYITGKE